MPDSYPTFCTTMGIANTFLDMAQTICLIYFLIHVIFNVNKSIKESSLRKM